MYKRFVCENFITGLRVHMLLILYILLLTTDVCIPAGGGGGGGGGYDGGGARVGALDLASKFVLNSALGMNLPPRSGNVSE